MKKSEKNFAGKIKCVIFVLETKQQSNMKEIKFSDLRNYTENNSVVLTGITPDTTASEVDEFFHETGFFDETQKVTEVCHLSDNVLGEDGRSDLLIVFSGDKCGNPMVRLKLNMSGLGIKWTSDFIDNYAKDYISSAE